MPQKQSSQVNLLQILLGIIIANVPASILFVLSIFLTDEYSYLFTFGHILISSWLFWGYIGKTPKKIGYVYIFGSLIFYIYSIAVCEIFFVSGNMHNIYQGLIQNESTWNKIQVILFEMPFYIFQENFFLISFVLYVFTGIFIMNAAIKSIKQSSKYQSGQP
jgi:hypothetical protein